MTARLTSLRAALNERRAVKAISGIANFDLNNVLSVVRAATAAGATAVDVAAQPDIVRAVRQATDLPVFASCVTPENLAQAVDCGADAVELGNYDALYAQGLYLTAEEVLRLAEQTVRLVAGRALISVTLPGHLSIDTQISLAKSLESLGVDVLQTEGAARVLSAQPQIKELTAAEKAEITLANTRALTQATRLPVMSASGIALDNLTDAFEAGAAAVGIGSAVNKLATEADMTATLRAMMDKLAASRTRALVS
jgi:2-keto-3-deoxy-6-phosphogluconate aldolase